MELDEEKTKVTSLCATPSKRRFVFLLVGIVAFVLLTVVGYAPFFQWLTHSRGEHLTLAEAKPSVHLELPEGASDIRFYQHCHPDKFIKVDFAIAEDAFLQWAAQQGWSPKPVAGSITIWPRSAFGDHDTVVHVADGYTYHNIFRGEPNTFSVTYDRATKRAYYELTSEARDEG